MSIECPKSASVDRRDDVTAKGGVPLKLESVVIMSAAALLPVAKQNGREGSLLPQSNGIYFGAPAYC